MSKRAEQKQSTREQLLSVARKTVAEQGFAATSTAAIAKAVGKAHGTVFVHFPTRDALVEALLNDIGASMTDALATIPDGSDVGVSAVMDAHLDALLANEALYAQILRESTQLPAAARARLFAFQSGVAWRMRAALARDIDAGRLRAVDPAAVANLWIAQCNHYLINRDLFAPNEMVCALRRDEIKANLLALLQP
ncbi:hypothetical protein C7S18_01155 [Ahniella affigens]|uniref:HTH tetR-type domain-containing protein n=1 Tax=Ahniella affigens TaxID=2021234 RepID=A0A2P1PM20_9GAMM|nr:TetR/AcrR family transcriptional regulator [Ahniella affigens]AVP95890.1 hypothetical protein C7S18_01155 [Ahniella affigens]